LVFSTLLLVSLAVVIALVVFRYAHQIYPHQSTQVPFAAAIVSLIVTVLLSVFLSNLFALHRGREDRAHALRDRHFEQLRPTLRREADQLKGLAQEMRQAGRLDAVKEEREARLRGLRAHFWPDLISADLDTHFPEYASVKRTLAKDIEVYDSSLVELIPDVESQVVMSEAHQRWKSIIALSKMAACTEHGDGMVLSVQDGGSFNFSYFQGTVSGSGPPAGEFVEAFRSYNQLHVGPKILAACEKLKQTSRLLAERAEELANRAVLLTYRTALTGNCEFVDLRAN
jgi:uncharacterized protein YlxW (UPF0749 family)